MTFWRDTYDITLRPVVGLRKCKGMKERTGVLGKVRRDGFLRIFFVEVIKKLKKIFDQVIYLLFSTHTMTF